MTQLQEGYTNAALDYYKDFEDNVVGIITQYNANVGKQLRTMLDAKVRVEDVKKLFDTHNIRLQKITGKISNNHEETINVYIDNNARTFTIKSMIGRISYNVQIEGETND